MRRLLALAAAAALAGCIQYADLPTEAEPPHPRGEPAYISVGLMASAWMPDSLRVSAMLNTGRDGLGRRRAVADAGLRIGGATLLPAHGDPGTLYYDASLPWREAAPEPFTIRFPRLSGVAERPGDVRVVPATRIGPAAVVLPDTGALVLRMHGPAASEPTEVTWSAIVSSDAGSLVLNRAGPLPDALRIPREVLPGGGVHPVRAIVRYNLWMDGTPEDPQPEYGALIWFTAELHWSVLADAGP